MAGNVLAKTQNMFNLDHIIQDILLTSKKIYPGQKPVVCVAFCQKSVYLGTNTRKSHPSMKLDYINGQESACCHAEVNAIAKIPRQIRSKAKLYIFRILRNGTISMAKPCDLCRIFLIKNEIDMKNVFYSNWTGVWNRAS